MSQMMNRSPHDFSTAYLIGKRVECPRCHAKTFEITMAYPSAIMEGTVSLHFECKTSGCRSFDWKRIPMPEVADGPNEKLNA